MFHRELQLAIDAANDGARVVREASLAGRTASDKAPRSPVTSTDLSGQAAISRILRLQRPHDVIIGEEDSADRNLARHIPDDAWLIDPLDGTTNFARGIPFYCVSVGYIHAGVPVVGAVVEAVRSEVFSGAKREGSFVDDVRLSVTTTKSLEDAVVGFDWPRSNLLRAACVQGVSALAGRARSLRAMGSAALALAYLASGAIDAYFHLDADPWDVCAGHVLVAEAGGSIVTTDGRAWDREARTCIATNRWLEGQMLELLGHR